MGDEPDEFPEADSKLVGIGGWLILPAIHVVAAPVLTIYSSLTALTRNLEIPRLQPLTVGAAIIDAPFVLFALIAAVAFFSRKRVAPKLMIAMYAIGVLSTAVGEVFVVYSLNVEAQFGAILRTGIVAAIWIPYFLVSKRVKATFTR